MEGRDVVAIAKTGSGKTMGFLLPGFMHIKKKNMDPRGGPIALVLAPTRELANQIQSEADKFGRLSRIRNTYATLNNRVPCRGARPRFCTDGGAQNGFALASGGLVRLSWRQARAGAPAHSSLTRIVGVPCPRHWARR